jgi:serine/threonine-protein kinase RsbW
MPLETHRKVEIDSDFAQANQVEDQIVQAAKVNNYGEEAIFALRLSLEEALSNAIRHGNVGDISKKVRIRYLVNAEHIEIFVADEGKGFNPDNLPDPTVMENLENPSGRGIMLMRAYMNKVEYNETGNQVHLVKLHRAV